MINFLTLASVGFILWQQTPARGAEPPKIAASRAGAALSLSWPGMVKTTDGSTVRPYFELQRSSDLRLWQGVGERQHAAAAGSAPSLGVTLALDQPDSFYRLLSVEPQPVAKLATGGAEVFGYGDAFTDELQRVGQISPDQFAAMFPTVTNIQPTSQSFGVVVSDVRGSVTSALARIFVAPTMPQQPAAARKQRA